MIRNLICAAFITLIFNATSLADDTYIGGESFGDPTISSSSPAIAIHTITGADFENRTVTGVSVQLTNITHDWVGDLVVSLSKGSESVFLFNRVGQMNGSGSGYGSVLGASDGQNGRVAASYDFSDSGDSFWSAANQPIGTFIANVVDYQPSGVGEAPQSLDSTFAGTSLVGNWTLSVFDQEINNDTGNMIEAFQLTITHIPEPGAVAGLAIFGMFGTLYLRRRYRLQKATSKE